MNGPRPSNTLRDYRDVHAGATLLVCGCGRSLNALPADYAGITIGVNDVGRRLDPTYLVVLNPRSQFQGERFRHVAESRARALFTQLELGIAHPGIVRFRLGERGGTDLASDTTLPYTRNSTYVALCLAIYMGATKIGLIGVDFTDDHFFAATGTHRLSREIETINQEFAALAGMASERGVSIVNLSAESRVTAFEKRPLRDFLDAPRADLGGVTERPTRSARVFFVDYRFKTCGDVFTTGLRHAAERLAIDHAGADWDDPALPHKVAAFAPDLLFVVHGRKFVRRWRRSIAHPNSAVWLLDEPYEVDDTARYSGQFGTVFVNDYATLSRHRNAHFLPVAHDPTLHLDAAAERDYAVGFIGGYSPTRERLLDALLEAGRLSYVVGGGWRSRGLRAVTIADSLDPQEVARLYQRTRVVINVFRDRHHYNTAGVAAKTLNPRVYEALACGAVVLTEPREELARVFPALPTFTDADGLVKRAETLLADDGDRNRIVAECKELLGAHSYQERLQRVLEVCMPQDQESTGPTRATPATPAAPAPAGGDALPPDWVRVGQVTTLRSDGGLCFEMAADGRPGAERGIASAASLGDVELVFDLRMERGACFIAKIHQQDQLDQTSNSYHLMCRPEISYLGMHNRVLTRLPLRTGSWQRIALRHVRGRLEIDVNGRPLYSRFERGLAAGYCFLGVKGGTAEVRSLSLGTPGMAEAPAGAAAPAPDHELLHDFGEVFAPRVSIVTTVYDRVDCLTQCLASVSRLRYRDFEHIVVADHPPASTLARIGEVVARDGSPRLRLMTLRRRHDNWGIAPAAAGLSVARGEYLCFLSDDNGYAPEHLDPLVEVLDRAPHLGFAYSSCKYAGRLVLRGPVPRPGGIDLGQPLFRRELFDRYLGGGLPFDVMAWDWHMIKAFMDRGVRWRHLNRETFLFRLQACLPALGTGT